MHIFASLINAHSLQQGLFIKKSIENRLYDTLATSATMAERCYYLPNDGNYKFTTKMNSQSFLLSYFNLSNSGWVLALIQHRFAFLCSIQKGPSCYMRRQLSW